MEHNSQPLITVIIAVFNGSTTIQQCIDSVVQQTYQNIQLIIIDGGSTDGTVDCLKLNNTKISYWVSEKDSGVYNAWNKGLEKSEGDWVCFLGADDFFWSREALSQVGDKLKNIPPDIRLAYTQIMLLSVKGEAMFVAGEPWNQARKYFLKGKCLSHQGVMHRRSLFEQNGKFDESFRIGGDYELMLRELKKVEAVFIPDIIVAGMRQGGLSSNPFSSIEAMRDIRRAQIKHGLYWPSFFWVRAMIRVYVRLFLWKFLGEKLTKKLLDLGRRLKGMPPYWTDI